MSSIRISQVVVFTYRRRSLSYDIVAMCGWQLILRYRLIDIIPKCHITVVVFLTELAYSTWLPINALYSKINVFFFQVDEIVFEFDMLTMLQGLFME